MESSHNDKIIIESRDFNFKKLTLENKNSRLTSNTYGTL